MNEFAEIIAKAQPHPQFDWLLPTTLVAAGYGCSEGAIRSQKSRHSDELLENLHWVKLPAINGLYKIFWTKRGVIRLGFFLESARAKAFRNFAESVVLGAVSSNSNSRKPTELPGQIVISPKAQINQFQTPQRSLSRNDAMNTDKGLQPITPTEIIRRNTPQKHKNASGTQFDSDEFINEWEEEYLSNSDFDRQPGQQVMVVVNNSNFNSEGKDLPASIIMALWLTIIATFVICSCFLVVAWTPALMPNRQHQEVSK